MRFGRASVVTDAAFVARFGPAPTPAASSSST
jgi:hypothetical protein